MGSTRDGAREENVLSAIRASRPRDGATHDALRRAVLAYLSECDNPVPDYNYRRTLRNHLRGLTGAPAEPRPREHQ